MTPRLMRVVRSVRAGLLVFGIGCLGTYGAATVSTWSYQRDAKAALRDMRAVPSRPSVPKTGDLIGRIDIPRLGLSAAVAEGDDDRTLDKAVGHLPDTPFPWQRRGNVALAAHRDRLFRRLEHVRVDDDIRMVTPRGDFHYRVRRTRIVNPDDVWVVAPTKHPTLTLITCYPFSFVGNAPQRFIVQAELVGHVPGSAVTGSVVQ